MEGWGKEGVGEKGVKKEVGGERKHSPRHSTDYPVASLPRQGIRQPATRALISGRYNQDLSDAGNS